MPGTLPVLRSMRFLDITMKARVANSLNYFRKMLKKKVGKTEMALIPKSRMKCRGDEDVSFPFVF